MSLVEIRGPKVEGLLKAPRFAKIIWAFTYLWRPVLSLRRRLSTLLSSTEMHTHPAIRTKTRGPVVMTTCMLRADISSHPAATTTSSKDRGCR